MKLSLTLKFGQLIENQIRKISVEKVCRKCALKASLRPLFDFRKWCNHPMHASNSLKIKYFERDYKRKLKKVCLLFAFEPNSFYLTRLKRGLEPVTSLSSGYKTYSKKF